MADFRYVCTINLASNPRLRRIVLIRLLMAVRIGFSLHRIGTREWLLFSNETTDLKKNTEFLDQRIDYQILKMVPALCS
jgi:hypothetical protein